MGPMLVRRRAWRGVQTVLPMKGIMRTSIRTWEMVMPQTSVLGSLPDLSFFFTAMRNMQTDKTNFLFVQDQPYHPSYLVSEHAARVFLPYSSPLAQMTAPGKYDLVTRTLPRALGPHLLSLPAC